MKAISITKNTKKKKTFFITLPYKALLTENATDKLVTCLCVAHGQAAESSFSV
ncbi:MAG: hypothetical protein R6V06_03030 [Kiritimatiellia bacterium]